MCVPSGTVNVPTEEKLEDEVMIEEIEKDVSPEKDGRRSSLHCQSETSNGGGTKPRRSSTRISQGTVNASTEEKLEDKSNY